MSKVFTAEYDKKDVGTRVWLPLAGAAVLGMSGLLLGLPILSVFAAGMTFVALRFWPLSRVNRPALRLSDQGAEIDGLGLVKWPDIAAVDSGMVKVKALKIPAIDLTFRRPLPDVFTPSEATRLRPWEIRIFQLRKDGKMRLDMSRIEDSADEVLSAFRHFRNGLH